MYAVHSKMGTPRFTYIKEFADAFRCLALDADSTSRSTRISVRTSSYPCPGKYRLKTGYKFTVNATCERLKANKTTALEEQSNKGSEPSH